MSEDSSFGLNLLERLFGLIILLTGSFVLYFTVTSTQTLAMFTGFFSILCIILIVVGLFLLTAKTE